MIEVDYSQYTYMQLLDAQNNINAEMYPERAKQIENLLPSKKIEHEQNEKLRLEKEEKEKIENAYMTIKVLGFLQLSASALILIVFAYFAYHGLSFSLLSICLAVLFSALNFIAGYTTLKQQKKYYWISIFNQSLQVLSISAGKVYLNYSGIGGVYATIQYSSLSGFGIGYKLDFAPGFRFAYLNESLASNVILVDVIAIAVIAAYVTVLGNKHLTSKSIGTQ